MKLAEGAGIDSDHTQQARAAAAELCALGEAAEAERGMVPDGLVPTPLKPHWHRREIREGGHHHRARGDGDVPRGAADGADASTRDSGA